MAMVKCRESGPAEFSWRVGDGSHDPPPSISMMAITGESCFVNDGGQLLMFHNEAEEGGFDG